jgi:hypothetical protein
LLPDEYNKTGNLDIDGKIKLRGFLPDKYQKTSDLHIFDKIELRGLSDDLDMRKLSCVACYLTNTRKQRP